jgi:hypothetical protein
VTWRSRIHLSILVEQNEDLVEISLFGVGVLTEADSGYVDVVLEKSTTVLSSRSDRKLLFDPVWVQV